MATLGLRERGFGAGRRRWRTLLLAGTLAWSLVTGVAPMAHAAFTISVRPLSGSSFPVSVDPSDTIASLKQQIEGIDGMPVANQRLIFAGRQLEDSRTISDYNIQAGSIVNLVRRLTLSSAADPVAIPDWFQSYARRDEAAACAEGWSRSWATWPAGGTGGWTCDRLVRSLG